VPAKNRHQLKFKSLNVRSSRSGLNPGAMATAR
jgi:hypothetical protein